MTGGIDFGLSGSIGGGGGGPIDVKTSERAGADEVCTPYGFKTSATLPMLSALGPPSKAWAAADASGNVAFDPLATADRTTCGMRPSAFNSGTGSPVRSKNR